MEGSSVTIHAFDFDGTLTDRDSLPLFVSHCVGRWRGMLKLATAAPRILLAKLGLADAGKVKERLLGGILKGMTESRYRELCESFAARHRDILRAEGLRRIDEVVAAGDRAVVVTASLADWVRPFVSDRDVDVIGTGVEIVDGVLTGRFSTPNCKGAEKVSRLRGYLADKDVKRVVAYGDSRGDRELLSYADEALYKPFR